VRLAPGSLPELCRRLRERRELAYKRDIGPAARILGAEARSAWFPSAGPIRNGDDAAALPDGDGWMLLAAEGIRPELVAEDPWFAGWCSLMVNLSDVAAMGGRPWAVVDVLFWGEGRNERVLEGMADAGRAFGVPVVGGHTARVAGPSLLAVAVVGRARRLIAADAARPGQRVLVACDLGGAFRGEGACFDAATRASPAALRARLALLPELAESGLVGAGKDVSMAGLCGSLLMMLESSAVGAVLDLARVPVPAGVEPLRWLTAFPSYGFVLAVDAARARAVAGRFDALGVACEEVGEVTGGHRLELVHGAERATYWDLGEQALTGFGPSGE
jgi:AIR synthase-related protein